MKYAIALVALAAMLLPACQSVAAAPSATLTFGFVSGEMPVTGEGLAIRAEILNTDGSLLGEIAHEVPTKTTLTGAAQGFANEMRDRFGIASRVEKLGPEKDAPVMLSLEGGYRFGVIRQHKGRGSSIFERGSVVRVRRGEV